MDFISQALSHLPPAERENLEAERLRA